MLHFSNKGFVNAFPPGCSSSGSFKLTNHFSAGFSYSFSVGNKKLYSISIKENSGRPLIYNKIDSHGLFVLQFISLPCYYDDNFINELNKVLQILKDGNLELYSLNFTGKFPLTKQEIKKEMQLERMSRSLMKRLKQDIFHDIDENDSIDKDTYIHLHGRIILLKDINNENLINSEIKNTYECIGKKIEELLILRNINKENYNGDIMLTIDAIKDYENINSVLNGDTWPDEYKDMADMAKYFLDSKNRNKVLNKKRTRSSYSLNKSNKRSYSTYNENPPYPLRDDNLKLNKKTPFLTYSPVYLKIKEIYEDKNKDIFEKQREVEYLINEKWLDLYISKNKANNSEDVFLILNMAMNKFIEKLSNYFNTKKKFQRFIPLIEMKKHDIAFVVFNELKPILNLGKEISSTTLSGNIGKSLYKRWIRELYLSEKQTNKNLDFNVFLEDYTFKEEDYHDVGDLLRQILLEDDDLFYRRIDKTDAKDTKAFITASCKVQEMFQHHHDVIGLQLPMICPPVKWCDGNYGGYLRNKEKLFIDLITPSSKSKMKSVIENELIYNTVNYLSSTPYKINTEVLNYINLNANEIGLLQSLHPQTIKLEEYYSLLNNKIKDKTITKFNIKKIIKDVLSHNSNYYLEKNILGLANLYSLVDQFFFTINLDWRGRLYSEATYLNFQGNDLSKGLILFKNGKIISTEGVHYLKIYGANLYGNNKLSFMDRIKWIDENNENILNMDLDFINKADKKFLFIAFCFEYKNYLLNPTQFITHLPILLDASCNGMQHLSAMIGDSVIAKNVNLLENDPYLKPYDFYTFCLKLVKNKLDSIDPNDINYIRIRNLKLDRSVVKRTIMTIPYNVSIHTISNQLSEFFEEVEINNEILLKPSWYTPDSELYISYKELYYLANLIHETLYEEHPKLKAVVRYFSDIAICLTKLNLPIMWNTPAGLTIKQNYVKFKKHIVKSSLYYKSSSYTINLPTTQISLKNQKSSFMPNLIHSMDASNIYLLVDKILKANLEINIFTVHDCFATTAETMPLLNRLVRSSFIELYSDNEYLNRMDRFYRNYIIENGYIIEENNVILENKDILSKEETIKLEIPQPPISQNLHLDEMIDKAIYLIH